ncbi:hypothetical protein VDR65_10535 [Xanthomonas campestris pv. campestris]|nr:hypothetical protein [Xanthomonas campestris pv. campestris]MEB1724800.1 hypothetical protein [Xanthomonas campestris pv. campestris]MEB1896867.1 hypothetical protein [Xanthomonas campestris pv. campestris]
MSDDAPSGKLMRIRVYEDDAEMNAILDRFNQVRENSRNRRGRARRGAESEWLRRILVAGYTQLHGPFYAAQGSPAVGPEPPTMEVPRAPRRAPTARAKADDPPIAPEITRLDNQTKVAHSAPSSNNDTAQQQRHSAAPMSGDGLDFKLLLGGGNSIVSSPNPTSDAT